MAPVIIANGSYQKQKKYLFKEGCNLFTLGIMEDTS